MKNLDPWKMIYGFCLLFILASIVICIALGKVEERTSYGLLPTLTMLSVLVGNFANWCFGNNHTSSATAENRQEQPKNPS